MPHPFLSNLGVSDLEQARDPTADAFPSAFNINCQRVWQETISLLPVSDDIATNWGQAIKNFIELCVDKDLYPFASLKQSANDTIFVALVDARKAIVKFLDKTKMLDLVTLRATRREVEMNGLGFTLKVYGNILIKDPTFEKWLTQMPYPRFDLKHEGKYIKHLTHDICMVVYREMPDRWHIGYEIVCRQFPDLPGNPLPSKIELEKFVLDVMWMPVLKSFRPLGQHRRLL